jgi:hypothetical protein
MGDRDDPRAFAPNPEVLAAVHDRQRATEEAARLAADELLREITAAASQPLPAKPSERVEHAMVDVPPAVALRNADSKVEIDPEVVAVALPKGNPADATLPPNRLMASDIHGAAAAAAAPASDGSTAKLPEPVSVTTEPGLGGPSVGLSMDTIPDSDLELSPTPSPSVEDAMREADLRLAASQGRDAFEREKKRRIVDEQTRQKMGKLEKGSKEHMEVLALRQKWTLPLDDADYRLWMQRQMLEQHADALAEEVSHKRIEKAKAAARGPMIAIGVVSVCAAIAGVGWLIGRGAPPAPPVTGASSVVAAPPEVASAPPPSAIQEATPPATGAPAATAGPTAPSVPPPATTAAASPTAPLPATAAGAPPSAPTAAPTAATPPSAPAPAASPAGDPAAPPSTPRPPATGKDIWEREF